VVTQISHRSIKDSKERIKEEGNGKEKNEPSSFSI
jgi:hypothetical protein